MSIEQLILIIYISLTLYIGLYKKTENSLDTYLFASRKLTIPSLVATLVCTWYGGVLEVGRFTYENGIITWIIFGVFYYLAAFLFAKYIVPKIIVSNISTIPELFKISFGKIPALIAVLCVLLLTNPAPYLKILSTLLLFVWDINTLSALFIGAFISLVYTFTGGYQAVIRTDKLQFIFMFFGFSMLLFYSYSEYGGFPYLIKNTPSYTFSIPGNLNWTFIWAWGFIALITFIDPGFYQRTFSGKSIKIVQKSIYISIVFWCLFDFMTVTSGIYALAILTSIETSPYLDLASYILPPIAKSLFIVSLFSIVMSTIDSLTFISGYTIGKDLPKIIGYKLTEKSTINYTKIGLALTSLFAILLAYYFTHAVDIWYIFGSFIVPTLLIPLLAALYKIEIKMIIIQMIAPPITSFVWYLGIKGYLNIITLGYYFNIIDPMYPGILISILIFIIPKIIFKIKQ